MIIRNKDMVFSCILLGEKDQRVDQEICWLDTIYYVIER